MPPSMAASRIQIPNLSKALSMRTLASVEEVMFASIVEPAHYDISHIEFNMYFIPVRLTVTLGHKMSIDMTTKCVRSDQE